MSLRQKFVRSTDSKSLWNCTLSPGWSQEEGEILRKAIMKHGLGAWTAIVKSKVLPGKTAAQLNLQTQRMLGQQSLGGFMGIKLDPLVVLEENNKKQGPEYKRKNGCLVNTGNNPTREERAKLIAENREKYELSTEEIDAIVIPVRESDPLAEIAQKNEKKAKLKRLKITLQLMEDRYKSAFGDGELPDIPEPAEMSRPKKKQKVAPKKKKSRKPKVVYSDSEEEILEEEYDFSDDSDFETPGKKAKKSK
eukprot:TRINITY_DN6126_c0_g1_i1.p1 TRINITY_DN6126_c0_g1~~TRINITY_DN6126_c0_g1_i1.p1  ORF type:complete len:250 (+),score=89.22 TRINITY_DN6126_c0_g1_i1:112-861(+)